MSIKYEPSKLMRKLRLRERASRIVTRDMTVNRAALKSLTDFGVLPKKVAEEIALKVIKAQKASGRPNADKAKSSVASRVYGAALHEQTRAIKKAYRGEFYTWLPSVAKNPRDEHIKNYGKIFQLGVGDAEGNDPGDLDFCQCGMKIHTDDSPQEFNERLEEAS